MAANANSNDDFALDPRTKFGDVDWEDDLDRFVDHLNRGSAVLPDGVARVADAPGEIELTAYDLLRLRSLLANYR